ncbi:DUF4019 domain-containing protein [Duganella violaceipulchra]|uniref:DUF4019 domain-containing protein n=1 Tax=Duganella violaceipulchra TaxID=2849652 RepID=A0AA41L650_9BURK|nr:DUF4019 domain-containing protein [Duganella violaceicalia]MBV6322932.1 DUF4019 domain-containing protein [Duganella violaceicalia]MCP2008014.1 hypothetical protein [Duganella violaceicalia]
MRALLLSTLILMPVTASAQAGGGIGYPTVAAALEALKSKQGARVSTRDGWTIVDDRPANAIWSFTPAGHPAHPAVVRRGIVEQGGGIHVAMTALCQADKVACDKLIEEFKELNAGMAQALQSKPAPAQATAEQAQAVERQSMIYFAAVDGRRYEAAYQLQSEMLKKQMPFEGWRKLSEDFNTRAGEVRRRTITKISWYKDPPQAAPGTYAAVDFSAQFANMNTHCGYLVWMRQDDGYFVLVREEQNSIDQATEQKLKPEELARLRAQFRCKD